MFPCNLANVETRELKTEQEFVDFGFSTMENAHQYSIVANLIWENCELFRKTSCAMVTNAALACELYMKSIIALSSKKQERGHELNKLFNKIKSKDIKDQIQSNLPYSQDDFLNSLNDVSEAFLVVRYSNESKGMTIETEFIIRFMNSLKKICIKLYGEK